MTMALERDLAQLLTARKLRLAVVETTCGGLICARLTSVPGSSNWFDRGVVAYSKQAKMDLLGIEKAFLDRHGSVSIETALEMATRMRALSGVDLGLAETGIAGGGRRRRSSKPVGTCFMGIATEKKGVRSFAEGSPVFRGDRNRIREAIAEHALRMLIGLVARWP